MKFIRIKDELINLQHVINIGCLDSSVVVFYRNEGFTKIEFASTEEVLHVLESVWAQLPKV
jgi:hypothetical protein